MTVILSIQDIGDSVYDSAVLIDNFRWLFGENGERTVSEITDSDGDGLPDIWESNGIDYDGDGSAEVDLPGMGADPQQADIFLEIDWMEKPATCLLFFCWGARSFAPDTAALQDVVDAFAAAPYANLDGTTGITLHVDAGAHSPGGLDGGGNAIAWVAGLGTGAGGSYDWTAFETVKDANFESQRRDVFHYAIYADRHGESNHSGITRGIPGADLIVSDGPWSDNGGFTRIQERGTLMHELGHNLDLKHGGIDHSTFQNDPTYLSVMNYSYQMIGLPPGTGLDYSRGAPFDDWANIRFDGGSIGDLGDAAPVMTTSDDELTAELAEELGAAAVEGDGALEVLGPNIFAAQASGQVINIRVWNPGSTDQRYELRGSIGPAAPASTTVDIAAGSFGDVALEFDASALPTGDAEVSVVLISRTLDSEVDRDTATLTGLDLNDPAVANGLTQDAAAAAAADDPPAAAVMTTLKALADAGDTPTPTPTPTPAATMTSSPATEPTSTAPTTTTPSPTAAPGGALAATGTTAPVGALLLAATVTLIGTLLVGWAVLRRRRTAERPEGS